MRSISTAVAAAAAFVAVVAVAVAIALAWNQLGASEISAKGWLAMGLGIVFTLALGIGLMTLVFVSSRRGYDDGGGKDR